MASPDHDLTFLSTAGDQPARHVDHGLREITDIRKGDTPDHS
ncbi:MAG: hypothetical protein NXH97_23205 [Rhodobacteraceae bacterium]|nr:hypothetical protein [Paracoccaceae bacterium]